MGIFKLYFVVIVIIAMLVDPLAVLFMIAGAFAGHQAGKMLGPENKNLAMILGTIGLFLPVITIVGFIALLFTRGTDKHIQK